MFSTSKVALFVTAAMAAFAAANPVPTNAGGQCNTGKIQCCNRVESVNSFRDSALHQLLGINLEGVTGLVGSQCSPLSVLGLGGNKCQAAPMCCTNNNFNGLVVLGCNPINIGFLPSSAPRVMERMTSSSNPLCPIFDASARHVSDMASTRSRHIPLNQVSNAPSASGSQPGSLSLLSLASVFSHVEQIKKAIASNLEKEVVDVNEYYFRELRLSSSDPGGNTHRQRCEVYTGIGGVALMNTFLLGLKLSSISPDIGASQSTSSTALPICATRLEEAADILLSSSLATLRRHIRHDYSGLSTSHVGFLDTDVGIATTCLVRILDKLHFSLCTGNRRRTQVVLPQDTDGATECVDILRTALRLAVDQGQKDSRAEDDGGSEVLYGLAGLLYALLRVRQACGKFLSSAGESDIQSIGRWVVGLWKLVSDPALQELVDVIIQRGRYGARVYAAEYTMGRSVVTPPLMWSWHGKRYLGAAHGVAGILQLLLYTPRAVSSPYYREIMDTIDWLLDLQDTSGNWPSKAPRTWRDATTTYPSELVHWCHGAPGVLFLLCTALRLAQANPETLRFSDTSRGSTLNRLSQSIQRAASLVYTHGFLRKGVGLCHGVGGSVFSLLAVSDALDPKNLRSHSPRPAGAPTYLEMATHLAFLGTHYRTLTQRGEMRTPDHPWSLYEGAAGMCCAWGEILRRISLSVWREEDRAVLVACSGCVVGGMPGFADLQIG
ncbi:hypothetical protein AX16_010010 [Volvariella volvacea WC 439]|nr:hypothetical protein AX16_010010 [Volvariella volvacea WC 439]